MMGQMLLVLCAASYGWCALFLVVRLRSWIKEAPVSYFVSVVTMTALTGVCIAAAYAT